MTTEENYLRERAREIRERSLYRPIKEDKTMSEDMRRKG